MCSFHCREVFLDLRPFLRHQKFKLLIHHNSSLTSRSKLQCRKHRSINRGRRGRVGKAAWKPGDPSSLPDLPLPPPRPRLVLQSRSSSSFLSTAPLPVPEVCMSRHSFRNHFKRACEECTFGKGRTRKHQGCC